MFSARHVTTVLGFMLLALVCDASAQWSPGGSMVYMGDLNLASSSLSGAKSMQAPGSLLGVQMQTNNSSTSNVSMDNSSINATSMDNSTPVSLGAVPSAGAAEPLGKPILDLSNYSKDRAKSNLAAYTNIMYPISGSRGTTTSTSGGGGCGGCGS